MLVTSTRLARALAYRVGSRRAPGAVGALLLLLAFLGGAFSSADARAETISLPAIERWVYGPDDGQQGDPICRAGIPGANYGMSNSSWCPAGCQGCPCRGAWVCVYSPVGCPDAWDPQAGSSPLACTRSERISTAKSCPSGDCDGQGNPISTSTGNKYERVTDYRGGGASSELVFERFYNSNAKIPSGGFLGKRWRHSYNRGIFGPRGLIEQPLYAQRPDGRVEIFSLQGSVFRSDEDVEARIEVLTDPGTGTFTGYRYVNELTDEVETYDVSANLVSVADRTGVALTLAYSDYDANPAGPGVPARGLLVQATDRYGRYLRFTYVRLPANGDFAIDTMKDPSGQVYTFSYDSAANLSSVRYPDARVVTYHYENPSFPNALTGITDENGQRYSTYGYDEQGRGISTELAGGANRYDFTYGTDQTTFTSPLGAVRTYLFQAILNVGRVGSVSGAAYPERAPASQTFDTNGYSTSRTDWVGNKTCLTHDARGLETLRTEGLPSGATCPFPGSLPAEARTITTEWHSVYRLPLRVAEPKRITTYVYGEPTDPSPGNRGSVLSKTIQPTSDANGSQGFSATPVGAARTWVYTYNQNGQVLTADGPRMDVPDVTTYAYHPNNDPDPGKRGNLATVTNAAGHVTQVTTYNAHGQPLTIVDPNGLTTTLGYDLRQRLTSRSVGGEITGFEYDGVGQVTKVTLPDGSFLTYAYDAAHRLTAIGDSLGNGIAYTLDAMGNRTREDMLDPSNQLAQTRSRVYSNLNRLDQEIGGTNPTAQITRFVYDDQGNVTGITDPLNRVSANAYDTLNRLKQMTDPASGVTRYGYDGLDQLTSVTDPRNNATTYAVDGLGNLAAQSSPDTASTSNTQDAAGNLLSSTDAKGQTTSYTYDALNRVTRIVHGQATGTQLKQVDYLYDQGANAIGRLTSITETSAAGATLQVTTYGYDPKGRITVEARAIGGVTYTTGYARDAAGRMTGMTYPSGRTLAYGLDGLGRVNRIETTGGGTTEVVVQNVTYQPFGAVKSFTSGNLQTNARSFDLDGRIAAHSLPSQTKALSFDAASRITRIEQQGVPTNFASYGYDALDRLTSTILATSSFTYGYDAVGNRTSKSSGASTDVYSYLATSNRLAQIAGSTTKVYTHDPNGSISGSGANAFGYDARGRLVSSSTAGGVASYQVNALGQRVRKTSVAGDTVFHYDAQGRLIGESTAAGLAIREYLYLGDQPVGVVAGVSQSGGQCPAHPALDTSNTFVAFARRERMEVHGGQPGKRGWEWGLGTNTRRAGKSTQADVDWVSGKPYGFVLSYDGAGNAQVTVRDGAVELFSLIRAGGMDVGNALKFTVTSAAGIGAGSRIGVLITSIDGQPVSESLATAGDDAFSEVARVYAGASLQNGYSVEGTVSFTFTGRYPPRGNRLDFTVTAGNVTCEGAPQAGPAVLHYVHADHLNTPRVITDQQQRVVWRWENQEPFGNNPPEENPSALGNFEFPLRFPGQYRDAETGLFYNYFRDYDPQTGRYTQSDPIGLRGGLNTYLYVGATPLSHTDPLGLQSPGSQEDLKTSSCGAEGGLRFPNAGVGFSFEQACQNHDRCYATCGTPKAQCDLEFFSDMSRECTRIPWFLAIFGSAARSCQNMARMYAGAVTLRGHEAYSQAQGKACSSCPL